MNQNKIEKLIDEIVDDAKSLQEDMEYGLNSNYKIKFSDKNLLDLEEINDKLSSISEQVGMQFVIKDFG